MAFDYKREYGSDAPKDTTREYTGNEPPTPLRSLTYTEKKSTAPNGSRPRKGRPRKGRRTNRNRGSDVYENKTTKVPRRSPILFVHGVSLGKNARAVKALFPINRLYNRKLVEDAVAFTDHLVKSYPQSLFGVLKNGEFASTVTASDRVGRVVGNVVHSTFTSCFGAKAISIVADSKRLPIAALHVASMFQGSMVVFVHPVLLEIVPRYWGLRFGGASNKPTEVKFVELKTPYPTDVDIEITDLDFKPLAQIEKSVGVPLDLIRDAKMYVVVASSSRWPPVNLRAKKVGAVSSTWAGIKDESHLHETAFYVERHADVSLLLFPSDNKQFLSVDSNLRDVNSLILRRKKEGENKFREELKKELDQPTTDDEKRRIEQIMNTLLTKPNRSSLLYVDGAFEKKDIISMYKSARGPPLIDVSTSNQPYSSQTSTATDKGDKKKSIPLRKSVRGGYRNRGRGGRGNRGRDRNNY